MADYIVGDLQCCLTPLKQLLDYVGFNKGVDTLWLAGDVVNRGPDSLGCLEFVMQHEDAMQIVLGNHDLHLLAIMHGVKKVGKKDTLEPILKHVNQKYLMQWLLKQPLVAHKSASSLWLSHAGIPDNIVKTAMCLSDEIAEQLKTQPQSYFDHMYGDEPSRFDPSLNGVKRWRCITNHFTRMRFLDRQTLHLELNCKSGIKQSQSHLIPWYAAPRQSEFAGKWYFGHWAALEAKPIHEQFIATDAGFVWGGKLMMVNHDTGARYFCDQHMNIKEEYNG